MVAEKGAFKILFALDTRSATLSGAHLSEARTGRQPDKPAPNGAQANVLILTNPDLLLNPVRFVPQ
jgi:hypothetical protein